MRNLCLRLPHRLVGYRAMERGAYESFREWVDKTRRRKDWKKISTVSTVESARNSRHPIPGTGSKSDEFIHRLEPALAEFKTKPGNLRSNLANLKQLKEPGVYHRELILTRPR